MKKSIIIILAIFSFNYGFSQANLLNAKSPDQIDSLRDEDKEADFALQYEDVNPEDILWSKVVYEYIDLNEKLNYPLLYPIQDGSFRDSRKSLWKTIYDAIKSGEITELYEADNDKFLPNLKVIDKPETKYDDILDFYVDEEYRNGNPEGAQLSSEDILGYNIKGIWYFDKKQSELKYRLLGIQPFGINIKDKVKAEFDQREPTKNIYPWIWYPSIREILHESKVFNDRNNNNRISFDDLMVNRRFSSFIYKYNNVYGDREISSYITKRDGETDYQHHLRILLESERIKKQILDFEIDMWGY
tara:strand:+ start:3581 stop:4486 length:906 start_codon:yes stop_codon:yes gene_type:complete